MPRSFPEIPSAGRMPQQTKDITHMYSVFKKVPSVTDGGETFTYAGTTFRADRMSLRAKRSNLIGGGASDRDCFVASLLAMTACHA